VKGGGALRRPPPFTSPAPAPIRQAGHAGGDALPAIRLRRDDDVNWIPDDYRNPDAGPAPARPGDDATGADGGEGPPATPPASRAGGRPDLSPVAIVAGIVALVTGPLLVSDPTARYVVLAAAVVALVFGALGAWTSVRRGGRLDYAVAAIITGGVSLYLWIAYVLDPPQGSI
jgi:hypothetical protein